MGSVLQASVENSAALEWMGSKPLFTFAVLPSLRPGTRKPPAECGLSSFFSELGQTGKRTVRQVVEGDLRHPAGHRPNNDAAPDRGGSSRHG